MRVRRIVTSDDFSYENAEVIYERCHGLEDFKKYFTHPVLDQVVIKTREGEIKIITDWASGYVELKMMNPPSCAEKVKGLVICGDVSFKPAWLIPQGECDRLGIPVAFKAQLTFVADGLLHICREQNVAELTIA